MSRGLRPTAEMAGLPPLYGLEVSVSHYRKLFSIACISFVKGLRNVVFDDTYHSMLLGFRLEK